MALRTTRVAVLGGGMGGLSAAYELTRPERDGRFDVTVYQVGWRLGGKGASSRNPAREQRIEEHGLHLWMGCYENAFRIMRDCYAALDRGPGQALATWQQAFEPRHLTVLQELQADGYHPWPQEFPALDTYPGESTQIAGPLEMLFGLFRWVLGTLRGPNDTLRHTPSADASLCLALSPPNVEGIDAGLRRPLRAVQESLRGLWRNPGGQLLGVLAETARRSLEALQWAWHQADALGVQTGERRRAFVTVDYLLTTMVGILKDGLLFAPDGTLASYGQWLKNLERIDDLDYREWLKMHGAQTMTTEACIVRGLGDAVFNSGFPGSAGAALNGLIRLNLTYRGAVFWQMQAGMGETVFTPMYEVLRRRGVRFEFFERVHSLQLDPTRRRVEAVHMRRQAKVRAEQYAPLVEVDHPDGKLRCWPEAPLFEQLEGGEALKESGVDMASGQPVPGEQPWTLKDFDEVVLAIPVGALAPLTRQLAKARPAWAGMLNNLTTTATQSVQLWFNKTAEQLGWTEGVATCTAYADPLDTWSEMSHLLRAEHADEARQCSYFVGSLQDGLHDGSPAEVRAQARLWMKQYLAHLLPQAMDPAGDIDLSALHAPPDAEGEARWQAQFFRANQSPSDRYVLSLPGTMRHRLRPHQSGFDNLKLAGDWTKTGLNVGSIEAAAMSGLKAAQALTGDDVLIVGDYED